MRSILKFLRENEKAIRDADIVALLTGLGIIFLLKPGGCVEGAVRIVTAVSAVIMYVYWFVDEDRKAQKHPRSPLVARLEKVVAATLWLSIGITLLLALFFLRATF
jgi:hypothetical protein